MAASNRFSHQLRGCCSPISTLNATAAACNAKNLTRTARQQGRERSGVWRSAASAVWLREGKFFFRAHCQARRLFIHTWGWEMDSLSSFFFFITPSSNAGNSSQSHYIPEFFRIVQSFTYKVGNSSPLTSGEPGPQRHPNLQNERWEPPRQGL